MKSPFLSLLLNATIAVVPVLRAQDENPKQNDNLRTQARTPHCSIGVEFGLRVVPPSEAVRSGSTAFETVLAGFTNGISVPSDGHVEPVFRNLIVSPLPGTVSFRFYHGAAGDQTVVTARRYDFQQDNDAALKDLNHPAAGHEIPAPSLDAPPSVDAQHKDEAERIRMVATYTPRDVSESCSVTDAVVVRWTWNGKPDQDSAWPFQQPNPVHPIPPSRSRVDTSDGIIDEITGFPGEVNKATQTVIGSIAMFRHYENDAHDGIHSDGGMDETFDITKALQAHDPGNLDKLGIVATPYSLLTAPGNRSPQASRQFLKVSGIALSVAQ